MIENNGHGWITGTRISLSEIRVRTIIRGSISWQYLRRLIPVGLCITSVSCGQPPPPNTTLVRDSAGITIVENDAPRWDDASAWRVGSEPALTIGVVDGEPEYQLFRASRVFALSDGRIVVANNGTSEVRYYDTSATFLFSLGGRGGGPGEFESMQWALPTNADSVIVFERDGSVSIFDHQGRFVDVIRLETRIKATPEYVGRFTTGDYLTMRQPELSVQEYLEQPMGERRESLEALSHDHTGIVQGTLQVFPHRSIHTQMRDIPGTGARKPIQLPVWFAPSTAVVAFADSFYLGTGDTYEISLFDSRGVLHRIVRRQHEPRAVTQADIDRGIEYYRGAWGEEPKGGGEYVHAQLEWMADTPANERFPPYGRDFLVDAEQNLWVERFEPQGWYEDGVRGFPMRFDVFESSGRFLGAVEMPDNFRPTDIGHDYVLGLSEDDLEVQYALKYQLVKP